MKLERISPNQIKYSISLEELNYKGFTEEEMFREPFLWDALFDEMLDEASRIYELDDCEAVSVEIYSMTTQELVLILTLDEEKIIDVPSVKRTNTRNPKGIYIVKFESIEDCISLAKLFVQLNYRSLQSCLFSLHSKYYLIIRSTILSPESILALCEEYGTISMISQPYLEEYGRLIVNKTAIELLDHYF